MSTHGLEYNLPATAVVVDEPCFSELSDCLAVICVDTGFPSLRLPDDAAPRMAALGIFHHSSKALASRDETISI
jgi:hypothetical protein